MKCCFRNRLFKFPIVSSYLFQKELIASLCNRKPDIFPDTLKEIVADRVGKDNKAGYKVKNEWMKILHCLSKCWIKKTALLISRKIEVHMILIPKIIILRVSGPGRFESVRGQSGGQEGLCNRHSGCLPFQSAQIPRERARSRHSQSWRRCSIAQYGLYFLIYY